MIQKKLEETESQLKLMSAEYTTLSSLFAIQLSNSNDGLKYNKNDISEVIKQLQDNKLAIKFETDDKYILVRMVAEETKEK